MMGSGGGGGGGTGRGTLLLRDHHGRDEALTRYRQKRKTRHFEKTIRYATRQVRPLMCDP